MKTRSRKSFATKSDITDAGGHSSTQNKGPSIQWDCADIDHMEFDESASTYHVFLKWPNGDVSEHPRDEIYDKCPQQVGQNQFSSLRLQSHSFIRCLDST
jgi:hypothetical protein